MDNEMKLSEMKLGDRIVSGDAIARLEQLITRLAEQVKRLEGRVAELESAGRAVHRDEYAKLADALAKLEPCQHDMRPDEHYPELDACVKCGAVGTGPAYPDVLLDVTGPEGTDTVTISREEYVRRYGGR